MSKSFAQIPHAVNEEVKSYAPGTPERAQLLEAYKKMYKKRFVECDNLRKLVISQNGIAHPVI